MTNRIISLDIARAVALILIITVHTLALLHVSTPEYGMLYFAYASVIDCGVVLFTMISGALLLSEEPQPLGVFFRKRFSRILIPFVIWAMVMYILSILTGKYEEITSWSEALLQAVPYMLENKINVSHWFVHMIIALYLITPVLQRAIHYGNGGKSLALYSAILCYAAVILKAVYPELYVLHYVSSLCGYLGAYIAGYYIVHYVPARINRWCGLALFLSLYTVDVCTHCALSGLRFFTTIGIFMFVYSFTDVSADSLIGRFSFRVSRYSYMIYLMHVPVIGALYVVLEKWMCTPLTELSWLWALPVLATIVVLSVSVGICYVVEKIPHFPVQYLGIAPLR